MDNIGTFANHMFDYLYENHDKHLMTQTEVKEKYEAFRLERNLPNDKPKMSNKVLGPLL